jgi:hypothetical protein
MTMHGTFKFTVRGRKMERARANTKLDFRFAGVDDAAELAAFIVDAQESERTGPCAFRSVDVLADERQLEAECGSMGTRWVVLETPVPQEDIVAAARIDCISAEGATVSSICVHKDSTEDIRSKVLTVLLSKIESVVRSHGAGNITVEVTQWQESLCDWLSSRGYSEMGGYMIDDNSLTKPTMMLTYKLSFSPSSADVVSSSAGADISEEPLIGPDGAHVFSALDFDFGLVEGTVQDSSNPESMENLMVNLFRALHKEGSSNI